MIIIKKYILHNKYNKHKKVPPVTTYFDIFVNSFLLLFTCKKYFAIIVKIVIQYYYHYYYY